MKKIIVFACMLMCAVSVSAKDKQAVDVAVVNMAELVKAYPGTEKSETVLKGFIDEFEAEKDELMKSLSAKQDELQKLASESEDDAFSEKVQEEKRKEFGMKMSSFREHRQKVMDTLKDRQMGINDEKKQLQKRIFIEIQKIVKEYSEKKGFSMVIDTSALIYSSAGVEITDEIIKILEDKK